MLSSVKLRIYYWSESTAVQRHSVTSLFVLKLVVISLSLQLLLLRKYCIFINNSVFLYNNNSPNVDVSLLCSLHYCPCLQVPLIFNMTVFYLVYCAVLSGVNRPKFCCSSVTWRPISADLSTGSGIRGLLWTSQSVPRCEAYPYAQTSPVFTVHSLNF
jgi:hypothetical protein